MFHSGANEFESPTHLLTPYILRRNVREQV
jgi:hypothetical protein